MKGVLNAAFAVHKALGSALPELVYEKALAVELDARSIAARRQVEFPVRYRDRHCGKGRLDLLVEERVVVELKACTDIHPQHAAQVRSYLHLTGLRLGVILNFNAYLLKDGIRRVVYSPNRVLG